MAVKASANITLFHIIDIDSVIIYYLLQSSTANPPAKPTTDPPGGSWTTTEPTYTEGSTDTLYTVTETKYSDGSFEYTPVSKSTAFEAAKAAYNKATNALSANAVIVSATEPSDITKIWYNSTDNLFYKYDSTNNEWQTVYDNTFENLRSDIADARTYAEGLANTVQSSVNGLSSSLSQYTKFSDVTSEIQSTKTGIVNELTQTITTATANGNEALQVVQALKGYIHQEMINGQPALMLETGQSNGYKLLITNNAIGIYNGSIDTNDLTKNRTTVWTSDTFDVSMIITKTLSIGKFDWIVNNDHSISFKKVRS